jgi:hypothetical protein
LSDSHGNVSSGLSGSVLEKTKDHRLLRKMRGPAVSRSNVARGVHVTHGVSVSAAPGDRSLVEVGEDVFAYIQGDGGLGVANARLVVGRASAVVVDTLAVPSMVRHFVTRIARTTTRSVRYVVNTHHHFDHTGGNRFFPGQRS